MNPHPKIELQIDIVLRKYVCNAVGYLCVRLVKYEVILTFHLSSHQLIEKLKQKERKKWAKKT